MGWFLLARKKENIYILGDFGHFGGIMLKYRSKQSFRVVFTCFQLLYAIFFCNFGNKNPILVDFLLNTRFFKRVGGGTFTTFLSARVGAP
jgi:hypothetical protein